MNSELLQIRVPAELKERLKTKGPMSAYVRRLIEKDLGLSNGDVGFGDSQAKAERVGVTVPSGAPVAEPRPLDNAETMKKVDADPQKLSALEITALARKRWPHLPLVVAEKKVKNELG